jgi:hypothetical protein
MKSTTTPTSQPRTLFGNGKKKENTVRKFKIKRVEKLPQKWRKNMNNITEAFQLMDLMKKRRLQIEYLKKSDQLCHARAINIDNIQNMSELVRCLKEDIEDIESYIPEAIIEFLDSGDYEVYTDDNYGNKFWNEIELPYQAQQYFDVFQVLTGGV